MARNHRVRFADNNLIEDSSNVVRSSAGDTNFTYVNALNYSRSLFWRDSGTSGSTETLYVDEYNNKIYVDSTEYTVSSGTYTVASLQTELQTINGSWTLTQAGTGLLTFGLGSSGTFNFTSTTNAIWTTLGLDYGSDITASSVEGVVPIYHGKMVLEVDLGFDDAVNFVAIIGKLGEEFSISSAATLTLKGSPINSTGIWSSPDYSTELSVTDNGVFGFLDTDSADFQSYRYWRLEIDDRSNPNPLKLSNIFLGNYITLSLRNVEKRFQKATVDPSNVVFSEGGIEYFDELPKYLTLSSMSIQFLEPADRANLEQLFYDKGISNPFYLALDPTELVSSSTDDLVRLMRFSGPPQLTHLFYNKYAIAFNAREAT